MAANETLDNPAPTLSLHEISYDGQEIYDTVGLPFDADKYSRFKYGDAAAAESYSDQLAARILEQRNGQMDGVYIASSAYKHVPTAAHFITRCLLTSLAVLGRPPQGTFRIDRGVVFDHDYAALTEEERAEAMANNELDISPTDAAALQSKDIIIVDDIKVTGRHEQSLRCELGRVGLKNILFGYVATIDPELAATHPEVEDILNSAEVKSVFDIIPIIESGHFYLNARTCKYILKQDPATVSEFMASIPLPVAQTILSSVVADGYHTMERFAPQFGTMADVIAARQLINH